MIENAVPLADVAKVMRKPLAEVRAEAEALGMFVGGQDWACRPAVTQDEAHGLVTGSSRRETDQRAEWMEHLRQTEEWEARRDQVRRDTAQATRLDVLRRGVGEPAAQTAAHEAAAAAVERFERQNPAPTYGGNATAKSWVAGVVDKMRGAVA